MIRTKVYYFYSEIQSELSKIMMINDKLELKLCEEKNNNEKLVSSLQNEMKALKDKCSVMEKLHLKQDKVCFFNYSFSE